MSSPTPETKCRTHKEYTIGWVCALPKELTAATAMLDTEHPDLETPATDQNSYTLGSIGEHNIVIATLPKGQIGTNSAAVAAAQMVNTFPNIKFGLMVGIGGGVPPKVRLGDVVVSAPGLTEPGVVQWDMGKAVEGGSGFERTGTLNNPPRSVLTALSKVESKYALGISKIPEHLEELKKKYPSLASSFLRREGLRDVAFKSNVPHVGKSIEEDGDEEEEEEEEGEENDCRLCDKTKTFKENTRGILVHFGLIASGNKVVKDAKVRNQINKELGGRVLCLEMEAAGLSNIFPCLIIRGICDYADAHKNKIWQEYAATVAAAFAKELLGYVQGSQVDQEKPVKDLLNQISDDVSKIEAQVTTLKSNWDEKENREILQWLTETDYGPIQTDKVREKQAGTGQWFLESPQFEEWYHNNGQTLFCPGRPGAGKTIITATVIERILKLHGQDDHIGIAYIYFNFKNVNEQKPEKVFASLLKQLTQKLAELPACVKELYERHERTKTHPVVEEYLQSLRSVAFLYSRVFILIDALDECDSSRREGLLSKILTFQSEHRANIFVTSRFLPDIEIFFTDQPRMEIYGSEDDLKKYMDANSQHILRIMSNKVDLWELVMSKTIEAANGIFLLVKLRLDSLGGMISENEIRKMIEKGPGTGFDNVYDDAYNEVMSRIHDQPKRSSEHAIKALSWVTGSKRPLTTLEFRHALGIQVGQSKFDERDIPDLGRLMSFCCGLLMVDQESDVIRLVHYTAQEYLVKMQKMWLPRMDIELAESCITYLSYDIFKVEGARANYKDFEERLECNPLYDYAARNWGYHAREAAIEDNPLTLHLLGSDTALSACSQIFIIIFFPRSRANYHPQTSMNPKWTWLHLAAVFGMHESIKAMLSDETLFDLPDYWGETPLLVAATEGYIEVVRLLVEKGADLEAKNTVGRSALSLAAGRGHQAVTNFLIERGANLETQSNIRKTPLFYAVVGGWGGTTSLLLEKGADINAKDNTGHSALILALGNSNEEIVRLLVKKGAELDAQDRNGQTPLIRMIEQGKEVMARVLVESGAGLEKTDVWGRTPLSRATERGREATAKLLIENGADMEPRGRSVRYNQTPLWWAAHNGQLAVVRRLVENGADPDSNGKCGKPPLSRAAERGNKDVVRYLLEKGADIESQDYEDLRTPLSWAIKGGNQVVVRLLVEKGADIGAVDRKNQTPLSKAAQKGHEIAARVLIKKGADLEAKDVRGDTPLGLAARCGHKAIVKLLVEKGVDLEARNLLGDTPLMLAVKRGREAVVKLLVEKGANIEQDLVDNALALAYPPSVSEYSSSEEGWDDYGYESEHSNSYSPPPSPKYSLSPERERIASFLADKMLAPESTEMSPTVN